MLMQDRPSLLVCLSLVGISSTRMSSPTKSSVTAPGAIAACGRLCELYISLCLRPVHLRPRACKPCLAWSRFSWFLFLFLWQPQIREYRVIIQDVQDVMAPRQTAGCNWAAARLLAYASRSACMLLWMRIGCRTFIEGFKMGKQSVNS